MKLFLISLFFLSQLSLAEEIKTGNSDTEDEEMLQKFCGVLGHAYTVVDEGEIVIPRIETLQHALVNASPFNDLFS